MRMIKTRQDDGQLWEAGKRYDWEGDDKGFQGTGNIFISYSR